jgi:pyridoxine 5-phosphate synthase
MKLNVNIDHIATLRQARMGTEPDPVQGALLAVKAGAHGITFHLREDRRHILDEDVYRLKEVITVPLNFEGSLSPQIIEIILNTVPYETTLVPERREEVTTEGGLDVVASRKRLLDVIPGLREKGIIVSLFVDPDETQILASKEVGAHAIELHTGHYANARNSGEADNRLKKLKSMARYAKDMGLVVNAGHGLNYENTAPVTLIPEIEELNIGHSIISRSVFTGIEKAVRDMCRIVEGK